MGPRSDRARRLLSQAALAWAVGLAVLTGVLGARAYLSARSAEVHTVPCDDIADDTDMDFPEAPPA